jgi:hypothetical protein
VFIDNKQGVFFVIWSCGLQVWRLVFSEAWKQAAEGVLGLREGWQLIAARDEEFDRGFLPYIPKDNYYINTHLLAYVEDSVRSVKAAGAGEGAGASALAG